MAFAAAGPGKTERFIPVKVAGLKPSDLLERITPNVTFGALEKRIELLWLGEKHHQEMWFAPGAAPFPMLRGVTIHVTQQPRAVIFAHTGAELT